MTKEPEKPPVKPADTATQAQQPQSSDATPKAQFQSGDHRIAARDSAPQGEHAAQFQASDHKIALKASKDKIPKTTVPESKPKE